MAAIEASKRYPATARRRRITGTVEVSFVLLGSGEVRELQFSGGHPLLRTAAARAMQRAQPFPSPPAGLDCPRRLRFSMVFQQR
jgi:TonB family protein